MSHYCVSVISKSQHDVDDMLEPYCENNEVPAYIAETKEEFITNRRRQLSEGCYKAFMESPILYKLQHRDNPEHLDFLEHMVPQLLKMSDEDFYHHEIVSYREEGSVDEEGNIISTYNPNSKWDWYEVGGRWSGSLLVQVDVLKEGDYRAQKHPRTPTGYCWVNQAKIKDVEWEKMREFKLATLVPYDDFVEQQCVFYNPEYFKKLYPESDYEKLLTQFSTFAVLTENGWKEAGEMGWFGCSSATPEQECEWKLSFFETFIKNEDPENYITVVDCHI